MTSSLKSISSQSNFTNHEFTNHSAILGKTPSGWWVYHCTHISKSADIKMHIYTPAYPYTEIVHKQTSNMSSSSSGCNWFPFIQVAPVCLRYWQCHLLQNTQIQKTSFHIQLSSSGMLRFL